MGDTALDRVEEGLAKVSAGVDRIMAERDRYRAALEQIAAGEGYYGAQANEYKQIARAALAPRRGE